MKTLDNTPTLQTLETDPSIQLNKLLADEFIIMNRTVSYLLGLQVAPHRIIPEKVYDELKINVKEITAYLKSIDQAPDLSINNFITYTRLQNHSENKDQASLIQNIIDDHGTIISSIEDALIEQDSSDDLELLLTTIRDRHVGIATVLAETSPSLN